MQKNQHTLKNEFFLEGKGLHTGLNIRITFKPAPVDTGYIIRRTDLPGMPEIPALAENVSNTQRGTVLTKGDVSCSTVEHAFAALYANGIDNCYIETNAPEFPILDGSAIEYVNQILKFGKIEQEKRRDFYIVKKRVEFEMKETGAKLILLPDEALSIDVHIVFPSPVLFNQFASLEDLSEFNEEIAKARTFVFVREIKPLLEAGLIKGGDLDNALVIHDTPLNETEFNKLCSLVGIQHKDPETLGYIQNRPLEWDNEPARHKLLDVLGDLALIGKPIKGRIIAFCPGHTVNNKMARLIRKEIKLNESQAPVYDPNTAPILDVIQIKGMLPHRYPFLMVDKIIEKGEDYIVGVKSVSGNEEFFQGHFPNQPVMPGVLQIEAMAQVGGLLVLSGLEDPDNYSTYFMSINNVKFRQKVVPGDTLIFKLKMTSPIRRGIANMRGLAFVGERLVCEAEFMAQIIKTK